MVSYEKLRQSLRSWTLFIAWINVLAAIGKISGIVSYFAISNNLDELKKTVDTEVYQTLVAASNIWYPIIYIVALVTNVVVAYLAFRNLAKIKENVPSLMPYRIALGYTVVYNVAIIILAVALGDSLSITLFRFLELQKAYSPIETIEDGRSRFSILVPQKDSSPILVTVFGI